MLAIYKIWIPLLILLCIVTITDIKDKKIPNVIVFPGMAAGLFLSFTDAKSTLWRLAGMGVIFFIGMLGAAGLGDIKLWMMIVAFIGFPNSLWCIGIAAMLMLIYGLIFKRKDTLKELKNKQEEKKQNIYPFAPFILISTICIFAWRLSDAFI